MNVRDIISIRLKAEFEKRGLSPKDISTSSNLPYDLINSYLSGNAKIQNHELQAICNAINFNFFLLISPNYTSTKLHFRNSSTEACLLAEKAGNAFLIIHDFFPNVKKPTIEAAQYFSNRTIDIIAIVVTAVNEVKRKYGDTVEEIIDNLNIQVTFFEANGIEAFIICSENNSLICVNTSNPPPRIHFSLAHEVSHFLFDREKEIGLDLKIPLFRDDIPHDLIQEYIATKFAQFLLLPIEKLERIVRKFGMSEIKEDIQNLIIEHRSSKEVALYALYDTLYLLRSKKEFESIKAVTETLSSSNDRTILDWLKKKKTDLSRCITIHRDVFSEDVLSEVESGLNIHD